jgi:hypothetical protein
LKPSATNVPPAAFAAPSRALVSAASEEWRRSSQYDIATITPAVRSTSVVSPRFPAAASTTSGSDFSI